MLRILLIMIFVMCANCQYPFPSSTVVYEGSEMAVVFRGNITKPTVTSFSYTLWINDNYKYDGTCSISVDGEFGSMIIIDMLDIRTRNILKKDMQLDWIFTTNLNNFHIRMKDVNFYNKTPFNVDNLTTTDFVMDMNFDLSCFNSSGPNCIFPCPFFNPEEEYCDPIDGKIRYLNLTKHQGDRCPSSTDQCFPGAECYTVRGVNHCECDASTCGDLCERRICREECSRFNSYCDLSGACICFAGFKGISCETATCENYNPCQNNGTCYIDNNVHRCRCNNEVNTGVFCQETCNRTCTGGFCVNDGLGLLCYYERQLNLSSMVENKAMPRSSIALQALNSGDSSKLKNSKDDEDAINTLVNLNSYGLIVGSILVTIYALVTVLVILYLKGSFDNLNNRLKVGSKAQKQVKATGMAAKSGFNKKI